MKKIADEDKASPADEEDDMPDSQKEKREYLKAGMKVVYDQMDSSTAWEAQHKKGVDTMDAEAHKLHLDHAISQEGTIQNNWHEYENTKPNLHPPVKTY